MTIDEAQADKTKQEFIGEMAVFDQSPEDIAIARKQIYGE